MPAAEDHQRKAARVMLDAMADRGFALAGSNAIREHGITERPTADVDLFTVNIPSAEFGQAVDAGIRALRDGGYGVVVARQAEQFARLAVTAPDRSTFDVDMGVDWRAHDPVRFEVGPVLDIDDAVANKVGALYSRAEPRDFLDVDAIRRSGRFTDEMLMDTAAQHDPGFDITMFARQLALADRLCVDDVAEYGYTAADLTGVKERLGGWAHDLRGEHGAGGGSLFTPGPQTPKRNYRARHDIRVRIRHRRDGGGLER